LYKLQWWYAAAFVYKGLLALVAGRIFRITCFGLCILAAVALLLLGAVSTGVSMVSAGHDDRMPPPGGCSSAVLVSPRERQIIQAVDGLAHCALNWQPNVATINV
jgi:hypothetical protein